MQMAEITEYTFRLQDVATALVKQQGLKQGFWQLIVQFGFGAANMGPNQDLLVPSGIAQVNAVGLKKVESKLDNLTVDAAEVNQ